MFRDGNNNWKMRGLGAGGRAKAVRGGWGAWRGLVIIGKTPSGSEPDDVIRGPVRMASEWLRLRCRWRLGGG